MTMIALSTKYKFSWSLSLLVLASLLIMARSMVETEEEFDQAANAVSSLLYFLWRTLLLYE